MRGWEEMKKKLSGKDGSGFFWGSVCSGERGRLGVGVAMAL